ncbi:MAG: ATP-binding protein, partial [Anaerolineae bacterium]
ALRQGEERYRIVSDLTSDYAFALKINEDGKTSYEWVAGALEKIAGLTPEALSAQGGWNTLVHPDDKGVIEEQLAQIMAGEAAVVEYRIQAKDGRIRWVRDYARPELGPNNKPQRIFGAIQDITARKEVEQALKEKTNQQADLLRLVRYLNTTLEQTDVLTRIGRGAKEILQADSCAIYLLEADGKTLQPVISLDSPHDTALLATPLPLENSFTGQSVKNRRALLFNDAGQDETGFQIPDTPLFEEEHVIAAPFLSGEKVLGAMCLNRFGQPFQEVDLETAQGFAAFAAIALANAQYLDRLRREVERRQQAEASLQDTNQVLASTLDELRQSQENLVQQERLTAVGQLAAGIAHDFNNIMASIILYADLLLQTAVNELSEKAVNRIRIIKQQGNRAAELTQQILDFSRKTILQQEAVDLRPFLREIHQLLQRTLPENIHTTLELGDEPCIVEADATRLQQIIVNLALNARDAMPDGGHLHIGSRAFSLTENAPPPLPEIEPGNWVMISVSDDGSGIPADILLHIFEPFFTTKSPAGSGLGLAQVFGIVDQHHGHIKVASEVGQGTTFTIYLPNMAAQPPVPQEGTAEPTPALSGNGELLLVVEDEPVTRIAITQALQSLNYRVWAAANGIEA